MKTYNYEELVKWFSQFPHHFRMVDIPCYDYGCPLEVFLSSKEYSLPTVTYAGSIYSNDAGERIMVDHDPWVNNFICEVDKIPQSWMFTTVGQCLEILRN